MPKHTKTHFVVAMMEEEPFDPAVFFIIAMDIKSTTLTVICVAHAATVVTGTALRLVIIGVRPKVRL